jgi:hypothetical protein
MRSNPAMLYPLFALAAWTLIVLVLIPVARVRSVRLREIVADDFKYGESANVPGHVSLPNRNYMNLLELPMLFYVVGIVLYVSGGASYVAMFFAWAFVALRIVHSLIHLTYNRVIHRLAAFTLSIFALVVLWVLAGLHLAGAWP